MLFPPTIHTDRLRLDRLSTDTVDPLSLYRICATDQGIEDVTRYVTWDPHEHPHETLTFIREAEESWDAGTDAVYVIRPDDDPDATAGCTALHVDWELDRATLGLWLRKRYWGRGYSGERAAALLELAFARLDLGIVAVSHHVDNENSRRAIEKYVAAHGGHREGTLRNQLAYGDRVVDEVRYSISAAEYRAATRD